MGWLPEKGEVVLGKYQIVRQLGQGGMGVVVEAINIATDGHVALKLLHPSSQDDPERRARMEREARAAAKLKSRFVGRIFDFDYTKDGSPVMVMELIEGHDLSVEMRRNNALCIEDAVSYLIQACAGVGEAHSRGVIHRDIKPGNLFLDMSNASSPMLRVLDFGLSKMLDSNTGADLTSPNDALGTLSYMSPEQAQATKDVSARTDVWSLGIVLYRALMGNLPIEGRGLDAAKKLLDDQPLPRVAREGVPAELVAVVARALEKNASNRFADARALGRALIPFVTASSATTKLAIDELASMPSVRDLSPSIVAAEEGGDESTTRTAMVTADTTADTIVDSPPRPTPRGHSRPPAGTRGVLRGLSRETRYLVVGTGVLGLASLMIALVRSPRPSTPRAGAEPDIVVVPSPPTTATTPILVLPTPPPTALPAPLPAAVPAPPAPALSSAPRGTPRPKPLPPILRPTRDEHENPARL